MLFFILLILLIISLIIIGVFPFFSHLHDAAIIPIIDAIINDFSLNKVAEE